MTVLGIETATTVCAAAVLRDGVVLSEALVDAQNVHAEKLMGLIDAAFREAGTSLDATDAVAVSIGPGSFTGLRIGLSVAKGLVFAAGKALVPVSTLHALAENLADGAPTDGIRILPVLDARRGDVYCGFYRRSGGEAVPEGEDRVAAMETLADEIAGRDVIITGDARTAFSRVLQSRRPNAHIQVADDMIARCSAASVARIGERLLGLGKTAEPGSLEPRYLREFFSNVRHE